MPPVLPVDSALPRIVEALDRHRAVVLVAAPGAGKTTRVPPALVGRGRVLLLQPRRVAARAMARRIADERGWTVGREIGWHIRLERQFTSDTRLVVVTEGILTAYLQQDPLLSDVSTLIVDEFHERSVHADLGLALAKQAWLARSDLHIVVMSATLDPGPVSDFLGGCPVVDVPGTLHPLQIEYAPGQTVAAAVAELLPRTTGNLLCFLPGAREIAAAVSDCQRAATTDVDVLALHGSMDSAAQDAVLSPSGLVDPASPDHTPRRRVIIATNVAETSLTVAGVSTVIDSGLHKVARYDDERAVDSLKTERITLDSAEQRAGRAARLGPGIARRLWDGRDRLRPHREPEIDRVDLTGPLLSLLAWGADPATFEWFDRPDAGRIASSMSLLARLGAVERGRITELGRQLQRFPLQPRLARVLIEAGGSFEGCAACAWLAEPGPVERRPATSCDLLPILDRWAHVPPHLRGSADQLAQIAKTSLRDRYRPRIDDSELRRALLAGYPDRVGKRRPPNPQSAQTRLSGDKVTLATGHGAVIGRESGVHDADWIVALDVTSGPASASPPGRGAVTDRPTEALVRLASRVEAEWLAPTRSEVVHELDAATGSVKAREVDWYDEVILREHPIAPDDEQRVDLLVDAWLSREPDGNSAQLLQRLRFSGIDHDLRGMLRDQARTARRLSELTITTENLPWSVRQDLERHAPASLTVPSGRAMRIDYGDDGGAAVSVKLQELFGLGESPRIGKSHTPITFHLLAPSGRPVQTTQDLKSFWERTYPEVRKELRGRYPRHPWPEDPWNAPATHRTTPRRTRTSG